MNIYSRELVLVERKTKNLKCRDRYYWQVGMFVLMGSS